MTYLDPSPGASLDDLFDVEDGTPEIGVERWISSTSSDRYFLLYGLGSEPDEISFMLHKDSLGRLHFSVEEASHSIDLFPVLQWILAAADEVARNFEFYWSIDLAELDWRLPHPLPEGWRLVVRGES